MKSGLTRVEFPDNIGLILLIIAGLSFFGLIGWMNYAFQTEMEHAALENKSIVLLKCEYTVINQGVHRLEIYGTHDGEYYLRDIDVSNTIDREFWVGTFITLEKGNQYTVSYKKLTTYPGMAKRLMGIEETR